MTTFDGGPAHGASLALRRSPAFLRVCRSEGGGLDALDHPADLPAPGEALYAYRLAHDCGAVHLNCRPRFCGWLKVARYAFVDPQPDADVLHDAAAWRRWCERRTAAEKEARP